MSSFMRKTTSVRSQNRKGGSTYEKTTNKDSIENNDYFEEFECYELPQTQSKEELNQAEVD